MNYNGNYNYQSTGKIFGYSLVFFILGISIALVLSLIYQYYVKNTIIPIQEQINKPNNNPNNKPLDEYDLNIEDTLDSTCVQKRKSYDSDFERTIYPINNNEIIFF